jgi:hypothetical protein
MSSSLLWRPIQSFVWILQLKRWERITSGFEDLLKFLDPSRLIITSAHVCLTFFTEVIFSWIYKGNKACKVNCQGAFLRGKLYLGKEASIIDMSHYVSKRGRLFWRQGISKIYPTLNEGNILSAASSCAKSNTLGSNDCLWLFTSSQELSVKNKGVTSWWNWFSFL